MSTTAIQSISKCFFGKMFADKGYISQMLWQMLFADGIQLITRLKKNMKGHIMSLSDKILLRKRAIIETINDELKNFFNRVINWIPSANNICHNICEM